MKKLLRNTLLLSSLTTSVIAQSLRTEAIAEGVDNNYTLNWNKTTLKHDTVLYEKGIYKYNTADTSVYELISKSYDYYKGGIYNQKDYFRLYSSQGVKIANINAGVFFDSTISYTPNANGSLDYSKFASLKSTFANGKPVESVTKIDFSAYGLGVIDYVKAKYHDLSPGVYSVASIVLFPKVAFGDSIVYMKNGSYDTAGIKYKYNSTTKVFEKYGKTNWLFTGNGKQAGKVEYTFDIASNSYTPTKKQEKTYAGNLIEIEKSYFYNLSTKAWVLQSLDSTYKKSDGNTDVKKSYVAVDNVLEYTGKKVNVSSVSFIESTPKPAAPTNLKITASNLRTEELQSVIKNTLSWTDNSYNEKNFEIFRKETGGAQATKIGTVGANITTYQDITADAAKSYEYSVVAVNGDFRSDFSNTTTSYPLSLSDEFGYTSGLKLYPNPTQNTWTLSGSQAAEKISVMSIEGKTIIVQNNCSVVDASSLEPGKYLMILELKDGSKITKSVIKQ